jgi:hypothetical protein
MAFFYQAADKLLVSCFNGIHFQNHLQIYLTIIRRSRSEYLGNNPLLAIGISTDNAQG